MTNLQANFSAMASGDSGAPEITNAALKTGTGNVTGSGVAAASIVMQDYCFSPNVYTDTVNAVFTGHGTNTATYDGRFRLDYIGAGVFNYDVDYRYITASDKPFIFFIREKNTGEILHTWWADDPPPGYWHLSDEGKNKIESGESFDVPIMIDDWEDSKHESFTKFDYPDGMYLFREWTSKAKADKSHFNKHMSDNFDFDTETKLFKPKNLTEI
jgi:hypothetical protein